MGFQQVGADDFERADANPASGYWLHPAAWDTRMPGAMQIVSGRLVGTTGQNSMAYYTDGTFTANQYSKCKLANSVGTGGYWLPSVRCNTGKEEMYYLRVQTTSQGVATWTIRKIVNGAAAQSIGADVSGVSVALGDWVELRVDGTTLTGLLNGSSILQRTDSDISAAGPAGAGAYSTGGGTGEWIGGNIVADAAPGWVIVTG